MFSNNLKNRLISKETAGVFFIVGLILVLILQLVFYQPILVGLAAIIFLIVIVSFLYNPYAGILILLALRTATDKIASNYSISLGRYFSFNANALLGILVIGLTLMLVFFARKKINGSLKIVISFWILYLLLSSLSIVWSIDRLTSIYELFRISSIFSLLILGYWITNKKNSEATLKLIIWSAIIPMFFAFYQLITETGMGRITGLKNRLYGTFSDPNSFAAFVLIIIAINLFYIVRESQNKSSQNFKKYLALSALVVVLLATFSRGGWLGLLIFAVLLSIFKNPKILFSIIGLLIVIFLTVEPVRDRLEDVYNPPINGSVYWRFEQWSDVYQLYKKKSLTGYGLGTETIVHEKEFGFNAGNPYTHNDLLKNALESGIGGLISYFLLLTFTPLVLLFQYFKNNNLVARNILLLTALLFIAEAGFSMTSNIQRSTVIQWIIWFLVGTSLSLCDLKTKKSA